jgi:threonine dehydratase
MIMIPFSWITKAYERTSPYIIKTPIEFDRNNNIYLKWENKQKTGSFKIRGALNKVLSLQQWEQQRGLVTASAGNHGQGVAIAGNIIDAPVTVFVSEHAVPAKLEAMKALGVAIRQVSGGYDQAEAAGKQYAQNTGSTWISPYNDGQIIAGQGTICLEILKELPQLASAVWVVPVGGGGLISGIGACLKENTAPWIQKDETIKARLIGVQSEASAFMHSIYYQGTLIWCGRRELGDNPYGKSFGRSICIGQ